MSIELSERTNFDHRRDIDGYKGYEILRKCGNEVCDCNIYDINEYSFSNLSIYDDLWKVIYEFLCQSTIRFDLQLSSCSAALLCVLCVVLAVRSPHTKSSSFWLHHFSYKSVDGVLPP